MLYVVEVVIDVRTFSYEMGRMRTWLDHMRFETIGFRQIPNTNIYRVDFRDEPKAMAFAEAFAGQILSSKAA